MIAINMCPNFGVNGVVLLNFKARTVTESVSLDEISLILGMIKGYVIVTRVYLNAF